MNHLFKYYFLVIIFYFIEIMIFKLLVFNFQENLFLFNFLLRVGLIYFSFYFFKQIYNESQYFLPFFLIWSLLIIPFLSSFFLINTTFLFERVSIVIIKFVIDGALSISSYLILNTLFFKKPY